jgi:glycosyltransferase involved in cell wall biosynthesis
MRHVSFGDVPLRLERCRQALRILLSAYACEPGKGSESGVGWHWAINLAQLGHQVTVLTRANNRDTIEAALRELPTPHPAMVYYDVPRWMSWWKKGVRGIYLYYSLWQAGAYLVARKLVRSSTFDVVHHLTFSHFRQATWMGFLPVPLVIGPFGGGEATPPALEKELPWRFRLREFVRLRANDVGLWSPLVRAMFAQARIIFYKTPETLHELPRSCRNKCIQQIEIGIDAARIADHPEVSAAPELLYAGRMLYLKGIHLAFDAMAEVLKKRGDIRLTLIGKGPERDWLAERAERLGISDAITWRPWVPQHQLWQEYRKALAFIMPSLHDSGGSVVLEALASGAPVICLKTGGPGEIVPDKAGFPVATDGRSRQQVVHDLAEAILALAQDSGLANRMSQNAIEYARHYSWRLVVSRAYSTIESELQTSLHPR